MKTIKLAVLGWFVAWALSFGQNIKNGVIIDPPPGTIVSSWFGNTLPGSNGQWVQNFLEKIQVQADGTVYGFSGWDEAGNTHGKYKNGQNTGTWSKDFDVFSVKDKNGNTWSIDSITFAGGKSVTRQGSNTKLPGAGRPIALALANDGKIIVTDNGPDQQVKFYDVTNPDNPVLSSRFGVQGGYLASTPVGKLDTLNFAGLRGCGMDAAGNIYVAGMHPGAGSGSWISAHKPDGTVLWRMIGETFLQTAAVDPKTDGVDLYSGSLHYKMDYSKSVGKEQGDFPYSVTADLFGNATTDDRLAIYDQNTIHNPTNASWDSHYDNRPPGIIRVLNLGGHKYIFGTSQNGAGMTAIKFTAEEQATTFHIAPQDDPAAGNAWGVAIDDDGGVWLVCEWAPNGIRYYKLKQVEANGDLTYENMQQFDYPSEAKVNLGCRVFYDTGKDVLYFAAHTDESVRLFGWGTAGSRIFRYDGWLHGSRSLHAGYPIKLPNTAATGATSSPDNSITAKGIAWAGNYVFVAWSGLGPKETPDGKASEVSVFDANSGASVGTLDVKGLLLPNNGSNYGWTDITNPLNAYKRKGGEYLVIMEEDFKNKNLLWRWCPSGNCTQNCTTTVDSVRLNTHVLSITGADTSSVLSAVIYPDTVCDHEILWSSSNENKVRVMYGGKVVGTGIGSAWIKATSQTGGKSDSCLVTVANIAVASVSVNPKLITIKEGQGASLTATVLPIKALNKKIRWQSSDSTIASVNLTGEFTASLAANSPGTCVVTVTTLDGSFTDQCSVKVDSIALTLPLIRLNFNENTGKKAMNTGSIAGYLNLTNVAPLWSTNVPTIVGGNSSVDFGTSVGTYAVESPAVINQLKGLSSFTVTGWVNNRNSDEGGGGNRVVTCLNNGGDGFEVVYHSDGSLQVGINQWSDDGNPPRSHAGKITTDAGAGAANWKFFAVTYTASLKKLKFFFGDNSTDVALDTSLAYDRGNVGSNIAKLAIGHFNDATRSNATDRMLRGIIDQVEIYDVALSNNQIKQVQRNTCKSPVTSVTASTHSLTISAGNTATISATAAPADACNSNVLWASTNPSIAKVDASGLVSALAGGIAKIVATAIDGNVTDTVFVTVKGNSILTTQMGSISLYPNPFVNGSLTLVNLPQGKKYISIIGITGQVIISYETDLTDYLIENLKVSAGVYIIKISAGIGIQNIKLIVK